MPPLPPIYVVDDDDALREWLCVAIGEEGLPCRSYSSGTAFLLAHDGLAPGVLLLDMRMPRRSGLEVQEELARRGSRMKVVAITGSANVETVVRSMKLGALDVLEKPFSAELLIDAVRRALAAVA